MSSVLGILSFEDKFTDSQLQEQMELGMAEFYRSTRRKQQGVSERTHAESGHRINRVVFAVRDRHQLRAGTPLSFV